MGRKNDPEVFTSQLVRHLGELAWLPTFVLTLPSLKWSAVDDSSFEVHSQGAGCEVNVCFEIDEKGDVI